MGDVVPFPEGPIRRRARRRIEEPRTFTVRRQPGGSWTAFLDAAADELGLVRTLVDGWASVAQVEREWNATVRWDAEQLELFQADHGPRFVE